MDKDGFPYQSYKVTIQPSTSSWVVVVTPEADSTKIVHVMKCDHGISTSEPENIHDEEELAEISCNREEGMEKIIRDPEEVKETTCELELEEMSETIRKQVDITVLNCDEVKESIDKQEAVKEHILDQEEMGEAHETTGLKDEVETYFTENVPEVGMTAEYELPTVRKGEGLPKSNRTGISSTHRNLRTTTIQMKRLGATVRRNMLFNDRDSRKRSSAGNTPKRSVVKTQQGKPTSEASSISRKRRPSSTEVSNPNPDPQDDLSKPTEDDIISYKSRATGKPCRFRVQQQTHEKVFSVLITCAYCSALYCTRTRTGAPYTEHFLGMGVVIYCTGCERSSLSPCGAVNSGDKPQETSPPIIICDDESGCKKRFRSLGVYGQHKLRHSDDPVNCRVCHRTFRNKCKLASHSDAVHRDKSLDKVCDQCGKPFKNESELRRHHKALHVSKAVIRCELCDKVVRSQYGLRTHMSVHRQKEYKCGVCDKIFRSRVGYNGHHKTHFTDNKCGICKKAFSTMDGLAKHSVVHNADRTSYRCGLCQKNYKSLLGYRNHMQKIHEDRDQLIDDDGR